MLGEQESTKEVAGGQSPNHRSHNVGGRTLRGGPDRPLCPGCCQGQGLRHSAGFSVGEGQGGVLAQSVNLVEPNGIGSRVALTLLPPMQLLETRREFPEQRDSLALSLAVSF